MGGASEGTDFWSPEGWHVAALRGAQYAGLSDSLLGGWVTEGADLLLAEYNSECSLASHILTLRSISFCEEFFCRPFIQPDEGLWYAKLHNKDCEGNGDEIPKGEGFFPATR